MQLGTVSSPHLHPHLTPPTCLLAARRARRFSSGGEEDEYDRGMHKVSDLPACSLAGESWQQTAPMVAGFGEEAHPSSATQEGATTIALAHHLCPLGHPQHGALRRGDAHPLAEASHPSSSSPGTREHMGEAEAVPGGAVPCHTMCQWSRRAEQGKEGCNLAFPPCPDPERHRQADPEGGDEGSVQLLRRPLDTASQLSQQQRSAAHGWLRGLPQWL